MSKKGGVMTILCETEKQAVRQSPPQIWKYLAEQGIGDSSFASLNYDQVIGLIEKIVEVFQDNMYVLTESDGPPV